MAEITKIEKINNTNKTKIIQRDRPFGMLLMMQQVFNDEEDNIASINDLSLSSISKIE